MTERQITAANADEQIKRLYQTAFPENEQIPWDQRKRRHAFYLRNGFRDTNVYRFYGDIEMTILMMGPGTFTIQDWDEITGELRKFWTWD